MKSSIYLALLLTSLLTQPGLLAAATNCNNPCGPLQIFECTGKIQGRKQSAEQVYNTLAFGTATADKFCLSPQPLNASPLQQLYHSRFCSRPAAGAPDFPYTSYRNFQSAYDEINGKLSDFSFACTGDKSLDNRDMANFLSTSTQETTGGITKNNDGLYFRYENQSLVECFAEWTTGRPPAPVASSRYQCKDLNSKTGYWGDASISVVMVNPQTKAVYTKAYWNNATIVDGKVTGNKVDLTRSPIAWSWSDNQPVPVSGYEFKPLTDAMSAGYIVGMGPIQLTGTSMMEFFGWYYNHLATPKPQEADLNGFIERFMVDGQLAVEGAFFYWMYRTNGYNRPTLHQVLAGTGTVCHDAAIASRLVNGGCNDYLPSTASTGATSPGRLGYYQYFLENVLGQTQVQTTYQYNGVLLDNFVCSYPSPGDQLEKYCYETARK